MTNFIEIQMNSLGSIGTDMLALIKNSNGSQLIKIDDFFGWLFCKTFTNCL
jgi:hypothetical protein